MGIENVKRWHWILIGAVIGVALAYAWSSAGAIDERVRTAGQFDFERDVVLKDTKTGRPFVQDIMIHPPEESYATGSKTMVHVVTYKRLSRDRKGNYVLDGRRVVAEIPYKPAIAGRVRAKPDMTIRDYLDDLGKRFDFVRYRYGWWMEPTKAMALGAGMGVVVIGGIWPTLLNLLLGAGFGRKPEPEAEQPRPGVARRGIDWKSWFRRAKPAAKPLDRPAVSAAEMDRLRQIEAEYEKSLAEAAQSQAPPAPASQQEPAAPLRKLDAGPLEVATPMPKPGDDDEIEVKGEYYPVLIHHPKKKPDKHDEPGGAQPTASGNT